MMMNVETLAGHFPYIALFALLFLGEIGLPFPEDTTLILSGFLISQGVTKLLPTLLVVYSGLLLTDFSLYWVGKKYGRSVVEHKRFQKVISSQRLVKLEERFGRWGIWVVLLGRHVWGVRAQIFLVAGVMRMPAIKFLVADGASAMLTIALMITIGYLGGESIQKWMKDVKKIEHLAILIGVLSISAWIILKYLRERRKLKPLR
jgi:membrane protein DedA with SNARE-associated domain